MKKVFIVLWIVSWSLHIAGGDHSRHRTPVFLSSRQAMWDSGVRLLAYGDQSEGRSVSALPQSAISSTQLDSDKTKAIVVRRDRSGSESDIKNMDSVTALLEGSSATKIEASQAPTEAVVIKIEHPETDTEGKIESDENKRSVQDLLARVIKEHTRPGPGLREKRRQSMSALPDKNRDDLVALISLDSTKSSDKRKVLTDEVRRYAHHIPTDKQKFEVWKVQNGLYLSESTTDVSKLLINGDYHA